MAKEKAVKEQELLDFLEHMSLFVGKVTIRQAVETYMGTSSRCLAFKRKLLRLLSSGMVLSEALRHAGSGLDPLEISLIASGEDSGNINDAMEEIVTARREKSEIKGKMKSSMIMPIITTTVGLLVGIVMLFIILPRFEAMFLESMSWDRLPQASRAVFSASRFVRKYALFIFGGLGGMIFMYLRFGNPWGLPVVRTIARYGIIYTFFTNVNLLVRAGYTTQVALERIIKALPKGKLYKPIRSGLLTVVGRIVQGESIASAMRNIKYLGDEVALFFNMAVESGNHDTAFHTARKRFRYMFLMRLDAATKILNPLLFIGTSIMIGALVISMYVPIFQSVTAIKGAG